MLRGVWAVVLEAFQDGWGLRMVKYFFSIFTVPENTSIDAHVVSELEAECMTLGGGDPFHRR